MTDGVQAELALRIDAELGEGPVWDPQARSLYFVDILCGRVHRFQPETNALSSYEIGQPVGALGLTEHDDLVLAVRDGFARLDLSTGKTRMLVEVEKELAGNRMNDGNCDPAGRFWAGTMALDERPGAGALYRLGTDGRVERMLDGVTISNGLDWTADGRTMFYIDSPTGRVDRFDVDAESGAISNRRTFVAIPAEQGIPDGLTLDADAGVWVALWNGGAVHRYAPDGSLDLIVRVPASRPTSCTFGGRDLQELYITTAAMELTPEQRANQPLAGALFRCRVGFTGRPPHRFAG